MTSNPVPNEAPNLPRLRRFIMDLSALIDRSSDVRAIQRDGATLLSDLIAVDDWLPSAFVEPDPIRYRQYLLYCDARERFSVGSFVWGPGQATPIHDHTVWGLVGVLRGAELAEQFESDKSGHIVSRGCSKPLERGMVDAFGPGVGDIHRVANAHQDRVSVSIHVYGANIGMVERSTYEPSGTAKPFISSYANASLPNFWGKVTP